MKQKQLPHVQDNWQGYTMEEMMYQKAFLLARMEVSKTKLMNEFSEVRSGMPGVASGSIWSKLLSGFTYVDYAVFAFKIGSKVARLIRTLRR
ncbi:MAG: hypothetical protein J6B36_00205 [Muribaculaceae bacterium]|jgi:hypothetical protein|nr:hypothetical protein [Muribaculaceae bacterium]CCX48912.1 unknown [Bacteroides sp. CAG:927]